MAAAATVAGERSEQAPHILVFPYPAQGHMLPLLDLTHLLALRKFTITILVTPKNLPTLDPLLSAHPTKIHTLVLPFPLHPAIPDGVENVRDLGNAGNLPIMNALTHLWDPIIQWFTSHHNPPVALVSDFFLGWTLNLANQINIPRITFYSSGAFLVSVLDYCLKIPKTPSPLPSAIDLCDLPGSPSFKEDHLPSVFRVCRGSKPEMIFVKDALLANLSSWGCVFNTFDDLEGEYLRYLKTKMGHRRVYGVGPLSLLGIEGRLDQKNSNSDSHELLTWLDGCPEDSVIYICFGSQTLLKRQQMEALASGLEKSGVRFIWVVKTGTAEQVSDGLGVVPDGFEERVGRRGLVIKGWAPQVLILSHRAVGGFLSHCGWNSTLEAVVAGARILAWPMEADQHVNARLLVEDMGMAVRVCEGADGVPEPIELGKVVAESMRVDAPEKMRAKELREKALAAVSNGGSSANDLDELVREFSQLRKSVAKEGVKE